MCSIALAAVEVGREAILSPPVDLGRDVGCPPCSRSCRGRPWCHSLVAEQNFGRADPVEQDISRHAIGDLAAGQQ
jgi:hypothetical protein